MNRRNRKNDPLGIEGLLDSWMDMMSMAYAMEIDPRDRSNMPSNKHYKGKDTMSYEDREKDIVFTIDMPGVSKKDIKVEVEDNFIKVSAENGGDRKYNYTRRFKPTVDTDSAVATFTNGVLDIVVKKKEEKKGKQVKIK
jgi:HSP20 family molecular chaperone IbpA